MDTSKEYLPSLYLYSLAKVVITQLFHSQYSYEIGLPCEIFEQVFPFSVQNMVCSLCTLHGVSRSLSFVHSLALDVGRYVGKSLIVVASTGSWRFGSRWVQAKSTSGGWSHER